MDPPASRGDESLAPPPIVSLTFDDGPEPRGTRAVLETLAALDARATFFVWGPRALNRPDLCRRALREGHDVQPHCWRHERHDRRGATAVVRDVERASAAVRTVGGIPSVLRAPWGCATPVTHEAARRLGLTVVRWTGDSEDWRGDGVEAMLERLDGALRPGAVLLMHDGVGPGSPREDATQTAELVARLVPEVRRRGLEVGPLPPPGTPACRQEAGEPLGQQSESVAA